MIARRRSGSMLCPSCGLLVGVNDERCFHCGRARPGLWGFGPMLRGLGLELGLVPIVLWGCGALYLCSLAMDVEGLVPRGGLFSFLAPDGSVLLRLGASGAFPVIARGRWWTVLSASWLHGSLLHIVFNMMWVRDLGPLVSQLYGSGRAIILYTIAGATGFIASSLAGAFLFFLPAFLRGGLLTVGASASVFGLMGAVMFYGRRGGSAQLTAHARNWALTGLIFGFLIPGIDNWAHAGGFAGGYLAARWLDPLQPERGKHVLGAVVCLALSAAAVLACLLTVPPTER